MQAFGLARLGRDAEIRSTAGGDAVCNLSLAFSWGRKDDSGRRQTTWVEGVLWGKRAEALAEYLVRGQQVMVTIEDVRVETFQKRDGGEGVKLVGKVTSIEFAGPPPQADAPAPAPRRQAPAPTPAPRQQRAAAPAPSGFDDMDDDSIPY